MSAALIHINFGGASVEALVRDGVAVVPHGGGFVLALAVNGRPFFSLNWTFPDEAGARGAAAAVLERFPMIGLDPIAPGRDGPVFSICMDHGLCDSARIGQRQAHDSLDHGQLCERLAELRKQPPSHEWLGRMAR